ncbi:hypothetical protein Tco_1525857 [Tanacetum coccineum]
MFIPNNLTVLKLQTAKDLQGDALLHYDAEMELMNLILLSIPNDIYNFVDACTSAKDMWKRVERLMRGTIQNKVDRETHFTNEFDQFVAEPGEALVSVYNRFAQLMNDLERNDMHFPIVTINTKFLNSLQPEWLKYVTQVRLAKRLTVDTFDDLFYYLQQFEKLVNVSRAKKLEKSHDPLALIMKMSTQSGMMFTDNSKDPISSAMLLLVDYEDVIIMVNVIPPDHVDDLPIVEPNQHDNVPVVPEPVLGDEDEDPEEEPQEKEDDMWKRIFRKGRKTKPKRQN